MWALPFHSLPPPLIRERQWLEIWGRGRLRSGTHRCWTHFSSDRRGASLHFISSRQAEKEKQIKARKNGAARRKLKANELSLLLPFALLAPANSHSQPSTCNTVCFSEHPAKAFKFPFLSWGKCAREEVKNCKIKNRAGKNRSLDTEWFFRGFPDNFPTLNSKEFTEKANDLWII